MALEIHIQWMGEDHLATVPVETGVYRIGRTDENDIVLDDPSVAAAHAIMRYHGESLTVEDLGDENHVYVGDIRVTQPLKLTPGQSVRIGSYMLYLQEIAPHLEVTTNGHAWTSLESMEHGDAMEPSKPKVNETSSDQTIVSLPSENGGNSPFSEPERLRREFYRSIRQKIQQELFKRIDLKRIAMTGLKDDELLKKVRKTIHEIIESQGHQIPKNVSKEVLANDAYDDAVNLGPLEPFLADPEITEVMVNGAHAIYYEKKGRLVLSESQFLDDQQVMGVIERIIAPIGRRIDESQPMVDARLKDGSRVNAIIPPLSLKGHCITIRKFSKIPYQVSDLVRFGSLNDDMAEFFKICVLLRKNILISGGTGAGKTTLLNVISNFLPSDERIITIEDAAELRLNQHHVISLEARPPNIEGKGLIAIRDLVRNALRMRPNRIVVGECRGGEALDMLQAMNTGHDGSLTTVHANSPRDALARVETMVLMAGMDLPMRAIREQIASAIHLVVQQNRFSDGTRKITSITEIVGMERDIITMQEIFKYVQTGMSKDGSVMGHFTATGCVPTFMEEVKIRGLHLAPGLFNPIHEK